MGVLVHDWLDDRRPCGRAPMNLDQALTFGIILAIVSAIVAIAAGEVIQRWRLR